MTVRRKIVIMIGSIMLIGVFLAFFIFNSAPVTNQVEERQETPPPSVKDDESKKTIALEEEAEPKITPPSPNPDQAFTIVIDPGHQQHANLEQEPIGPDTNETKSKVSSGTMGVISKKPEYQLTLEAALILKEILEEQDFDVVLTREVNEVSLIKNELK